MRHPTDNRVHFSELKAFARSPAHYRYACTRARDMTRAMTVGAISDSIVFNTPDRIAVYPGKVRSGGEWSRFQRDHEGKTICIQSEYDDASGAAEAIIRDPVAAPILAECEFQRVVQWEQMGLPCASGLHGERGGIDAINLRTGAIWDVKIVGVDCDPAGLAKHAWRQWWHAQGAWLVDGWNWESTSNIPESSATSFGLICAEASPPHCVTVLRLTPAALDHGRRSVRLWLERLKSCEASDSWPGYVQSEAEMDVPEWMADDE
jgi:hypothetical protein